MRKLSIMQPNVQHPKLRIKIDDSATSIQLDATLYELNGNASIDRYKEAFGHVPPFTLASAFLTDVKTVDRPTAPGHVTVTGRNQEFLVIKHASQVINTLQNRLNWYDCWDTEWRDLHHEIIKGVRRNVAVLLEKLDKGDGVHAGISAVFMFVLVSNVSLQEDGELNVKTELIAYPLDEFIETDPATKETRFISRNVIEYTNIEVPDDWVFDCGTAKMQQTTIV